MSKQIGRDENISKNGRHEKLCGQRRQVENVRMIDVDQLKTSVVDLDQ